MYIYIYIFPHILCWGSCYYWRTARRYPTLLHHHTTFLPPHTTPQHRPQPTQRGRTAPATGLRPPCASHRLITLYSSSKWLPGGGRAEDILNSNIFKIAPVLETDTTLLKESVPLEKIGRHGHPHPESGGSVSEISSVLEK